MLAQVAYRRSLLSRRTWQFFLLEGIGVYVMMSSVGIVVTGDWLFTLLFALIFTIAFLCALSAAVSHDRRRQGGVD
jgi:uncharacterized membrane protein